MNWLHGFVGLSYVVYVGSLYVRGPPLLFADYVSACIYLRRAGVQYNKPFRTPLKDFAKTR